nr:DNA repair protein RecN [Desulfurispira natronophila]
MRIKNLAIIQEATIHFDHRLNILTGETGAGKSIIIDALGLICGAKAPKDLIRSGQDALEVQALFEGLSPELVSALQEQDIPCDEDSLIVRRIVNVKGQNKVYVNAALQPVAFLKSLAEHLVTIHAQNHHQLLLQPQRHIHFLDAFTADGGSALSSYQKGYAEYREKRSRYDEAATQVRDARQRLDIVTMQTGEIEAAELQPGEDEELESQLHRLTHAQDIVDLCQQIHHSLEQSPNPVLDRLHQVKKDLESLCQFDSEFDSYLEEIEAALASLGEVATLSQQKAQTVESDQGELEKVESRIRLIDSLKLKYGTTVEEILAYYKQLCQERVELEHSLDLDTLQQEYKEAHAQVLELGKTLQKQRDAAAKRITSEILEHLHDLHMKNSRFQVSMLPLDEPGPAGLHQVEFLLSANKGEALKPLAKVASGGEMSRIMLAIKGALAQQEEHSTTMIFDEVDTGVSGAVAEMVGKKLRQLARRHQVIVITHLPQVAVQGHQNFRITKSASGAFTSTDVQPLDEEQKVEEIARILSGVDITAESLEHARSYMRQLEA